MKLAVNKPTISWLNQAHIGVYLGVGALLGIEAHAAGPFFTISAFGLFMSLPAFSRYAFTHTPSHGWRATGWLAAILFVLGVVSSVAMFAERLYYVNADSYASWLATRDIGDIPPFPYLNDAEVNKLCARDGMVAITRKAHGEIVVRCNDMAMRPFTHVFIAHAKDAE